MRRKDREITDVQDILGIVKKCTTCHIAMVDNSMPYVVPMSYGFSYENDKLTLYFHSAKEGRKIDILRKNPNVSFSICVEKQIVIDDKQPCRSGRFYESVIGFGHVEFIEDIAGKCEALTYLMQRQTNGKHFEFNEHAANSVCVFKILVDEFTGKRKAPQPPQIKSQIPEFMEKCGAKFEDGFYITEENSSYGYNYVSPKKPKYPAYTDFHKDILIIDDDQQFRLMIKALFEIKGYTVDEAENGNAGKKLYDKYEYKVIISDIIMPECDGYEVSLDLARKGKVDRLIITTGGGRTSAKDYLLTVKEYGVPYGMSLPISCDLLLNIVIHMLSGNTP